MRDAIREYLEFLARDYSAKINQTRRKAKRGAMTEQQIRQEIETIENEVLPRLEREIELCKQRREQLLKLLVERQQRAGE